MFTWKKMISIKKLAARLSETDTGFGRPTFGSLGLVFRDAERQLFQRMGDVGAWHF